MFAFLWIWRASKGYRLTPWKSPYLRWRIETYWGLHAEHISFRQFWAFLWRHRRELLRFLHWAQRLAQITRDQNRNFIPPTAQAFGPPNPSSK